MWNVEFTDEREVVYSKIKNGKKHIIDKFWDEDQGVCWWHVYIVTPETPYTECTDNNDFEPNLRRITSLPDDEWDTSYWEESETVADVISRIKSFCYAGKKFYIHKDNELIEFEVQFKESGDLYSRNVEKILNSEIEGWIFAKGGVEIWLA